MNKILCFDLDGTLADLYAVDNWLPRLRAEDPAPYLEAPPMWDMAELAETLEAVITAGWEVRVITWLSKNSSEEYKDLVREAKRIWLEKWGLADYISHFHGVQYGATKADSVRKVADYAILVDDNAAVRNGWHLGKTIDPTAVSDLGTEILKICLGE